MWVSPHFRALPSYRSGSNRVKPGHSGRRISQCVPRRSSACTPSMATAPVARWPLAPPIRAGFDVLELVAIARGGAGFSSRLAAINLLPEPAPAVDLARLAGDVDRDSPRKPGLRLGPLPAWFGPASTALRKAGVSPAAGCPRLARRGGAVVLVKSSTSPATAGPAAWRVDKPLVRLYLPVGAPGPPKRARSVHATRSEGGQRAKAIIRPKGRLAELTPWRSFAVSRRPVGYSEGGAT